MKKIKYQDLKFEIYQLDWIKILHEAIKARPKSWNQDPVYEWRNASDEICGALIHALEEKSLIPNWLEEVKDLSTA